MGKLTNFVRKSWNNLTHPEKMGDAYFYPAGLVNGLSWGTVNQKQNLKDFLEVPEVSAVINYRAWAQSLVNLQAVNKDTKKPTTSQDPILKVIQKPNWFQTQSEFWRQTELFRSIFGDEYLYFLTPVGMPNRIKAMFALPPQCTEIVYPKNPDPFFLTVEPPQGIGYKYNWDGQWTDIDYASILHLNDNNVDQKSDNYLNGWSKLNTLKAPIENIRAQYDARHVIIANRGAVGILSNNAKDGIGSTMPMNEKEKKRVQEELSKFGILKGQYKYIMTNLALKWTQITTDLNKLQVYKENEESFKIICTEYGTPFELFSQSPSYENKELAEKQFYQDTVIPTSQERIKAVNEYIGTDSKSWELVGTFDHLPLFQEDIQERTEALKTLIEALNAALSVNQITPEQYQTELQKFNVGKK